MRGKAHLRQLVLFALAAAAAPAAHAASLSVDQLELLSHGSLDEGTGLYAVDSRLYFGLSIKGGDKFAGLLKLDFLSSKVEEDLATLSGVKPDWPDSDEKKTALLDRIYAPGLRLRTVALTARRLFGISGLEASYFIGNFGTLCAGDDFIELFGAAPFTTAMRGPMVYPSGILGNPGVYYDGIHGIYGTGFRIGLVAPRAASYLYVYQDADLGPGQWSADLRGMLDSGRLKLELFAGASYATSSLYGYYRGGLLFYYAPGSVGEFYAQVGAPRIDPEAGLSAENFYFLFEPRVNFGAGLFAITVFYHPSVYRQKPTQETGALDLGFNLRFGNMFESARQFGIESILAFRPTASTSDTTLAVDIAPYFSAIASGLEWNFKLDLRVFPFPATWYGMFRPFIGAKTSF